MSTNSLSPKLVPILLAIIFVSILGNIYLYFTRNQPFTPLVPDTSIFITPTPYPPTATPITRQQYQHSRLKYQISYPSSWQLEVDGQYPDIVNLTLGDLARITIDPTNQLQITPTIKQWVEKTNHQTSTDPNRKSFSSLLTILPDDGLITNQVGKSLVILDEGFFEQNGKQYLFTRGNTIYNLTAVYYGENSSASIDINGIVSSLKFID